MLIPKGYVETVDGYIVKKSECKTVTVTDDFVTISSNNGSRNKYYRKEVAPKYCIEFNSCNSEIFSIKEDGTPIGYYSKEEVEKLEAEIKKLKEFIAKLDETNINLIDENVELQFEIKDLKKKKKARGRPNGSKNKE